MKPLNALPHCYILYTINTF